MNGYNLIRKWERTRSVIRMSDLIRAGLSFEDAFELLEKEEELGRLHSVLEVFCPSCEKFTGLFYPSFFDLPKSVICPHCHAEIDDLIAENTVVVYQNRVVF